MFSLLPTCKRSSPFRSLAVSLLLLVVVSPCIVLAESQTALSPTSSEKISPGSVTFGFDLGQSYGTSVARFENGTIIPLAKIPGTANYIALMENLVTRSTAPRLLSYEGTAGRLLGPIRALGRSLSRADSKERRTLAEMIFALKSASETALQTRVKAVAVTGPLVAARDKQIPADRIIHKALWLATLEPWTWSRWDEAGYYLSENNAALASEGRWLCPRNWCAGHWMEVEGEVAAGGPIFLVSLTNRSLYTSFQLSKCYWYGSTDNNLFASIDPRYGLDQKTQAKSPGQFWSDLKLHLVSLAKKHQPRGHPRLPLTILVMGEGANTPEFLDVIHGVTQELQQLCTREPEASGCNESKAGEGVELVVLDDPTYGPAKGAAFWLWTRMSGTYCKEHNAAEGILDQYDMIREAHTEL